MLTFVAAVLVAASVAPASLLHPIQVTTEYDHSAPLGNRSYSWGRVTMQVPLYQSVVQAAIDKDLAARGWQLAPSGGSATLFANGDIRNMQQLESFYSGLDGDGGWGEGWGLHGWGAGWTPYYGVETANAMSTAEGHLVVDIFDSGSHRLLFRGVTGDDLSNTEKKNTEELDKGLKKMFSKFPPKGNR